MLKYAAIVLILAGKLVFGQVSDSLVDKAIDLYEARHLNSTNLAKSTDLLADLVEQEPDNVRVLYEYAKVHYLLGDEAKTKEEKLLLYEKGKDLAKRAIKLDDQAVWAHFWYVVNIGRIGQTKGVLNSLASVPEIKKELDKILKLDPQHTGALDVKAMLYYELPGLLGGNLNKSFEALNQGIAIDSNYSLLYVDMGKVLIKKKEYEQARWYLKKVLEIKKPTYLADYILDDRSDALDLLEEIKNK